MAQTLLIGLGGTGSRVVNNVVKELHKNNKEFNNGEICCAVLDTNVNDTEAIIDSNTGVPVIPTSKAQKIRDYFENYHHLHMETWCPQSPAFLEDSMIDGASELRLKSRITFMDCLESGVIEQLEFMINDVLKNNSGSKIRIMIVSSLSGGTGSGMFIQVALWLRKFLKQSQITIRGIFLLPDVFVSTIKDIRDNKTTRVRHYCNAYAAIRELNTISKILKNNSVDLAEKISLGSLFDSLDDADSGKPVYDFAFFVDDKDENGVRLESITEYEKMVAQLVYMQLYAPMRDDMYSEEDNAFLSFIDNEEPLYGSCGTSKAVYPANNVKMYCAIRASQDALTGGWKKIDSEIDALIEEKKQREKDGLFSNEQIDIRAQFIKIFDEKTSVKAEETAKDRFFLAISKDTKNETKVKDGDKVVIKYSDKVADFIKLLKNQKIDVEVTRHSGTDDFAIDADAFVSADHSKQDLLKRISDDETGLEEVLDNFDKKVDEYADGIVNSVFPYSMGEVKASNRCTIYGLLTKPNNMGTWDFIHPVAARYLLYKLVEKMERDIKGIVLKDSKDEALAGGDFGAQFDNLATPATENSPEAFLNSRKWYQNEAAFHDVFEKKYAQFITSKIALCEKYEKECLQVSVYRKLIERLNVLIKKIETFFIKLNDVQEKLNTELISNINETADITGKTMFVYATQKNKESIYGTLDFELDSSNSKINKSVIDAIYGSVCAEKRPSNPENSAYVNISVITSFVKEIVGTFKEKIDSDSNNSENVNMDIYTALCKASDAEFVEKGGKKKEAGGLDDLDLVTGAVRKNNETEQRHRSAFLNCKNKLFRMAAPFLIHDKELSDNELGTVTTRPKTFWGFSPEVTAACPFIGAELGINADLQSDKAYPKNELYCYRAVYGMEAAYVPKFNELKGGDYYTCYSAVINDMIKDAEGRQGARAFVRTPHLDMNWHRTLPYITPEKQKQDELEFFHGFWLAIAYGVLKTDKDGAVYITRSVDGGYGNYINDDIPVMYKNKQVTKTDVIKLIEALRADKVFTGCDIPALEQRFNEELEDLVTYVGTDVLKGLTVKKEDLNPVNVIVRYNETPRHKKTVSANLISALEKIASELAERYNVERSGQQLDEAKFRICRKIYDSSRRTKGKSEIFARWESEFKKFKIKEEDSSKKSSD